jgi:hypothetical protein
MREAIRGWSGTDWGQTVEVDQRLNEVKARRRRAAAAGRGDEPR